MIVSTLAALISLSPGNAGYVEATVRRTGDVIQVSLLNCSPHRLWYIKGYNLEPEFEIPWKDTGGDGPWPVDENRKFLEPGQIGHLRLNLANYGHRGKLLTVSYASNWILPNLALILSDKVARTREETQHLFAEELHAWPVPSFKFSPKGSETTVLRLDVTRPYPRAGQKMVSAGTSRPMVDFSPLIPPLHFCDVVFRSSLTIPKHAQEFKESSILGSKSPLTFLKSVQESANLNLRPRATLRNSCHFRMT